MPQETFNDTPKVGVASRECQTVMMAAKVTIAAARRTGQTGETAGKAGERPVHTSVDTHPNPNRAMAN
jgi:hypothetical protein